MELSIAVPESNDGLYGRHCRLVQQCDFIRKKRSRITIISNHLFPSFRRKPESRRNWVPVPAPDHDPGFAGTTGSRAIPTEPYRSAINKKAVR